MKKTIIIGLTGQSGAGKTMLCNFLSQMEIAIIDCDILAKEVLQSNPLCIASIKSAFPSIILNEDETINRQALASIVFQNPTQLQRLNTVIFPYIIARIREEIAILTHGTPRAIMLDAPTLFESGVDSLCDDTIAVIAQKQTRLERIMLRDSLSFEQATQRINAQHNDDYYKEKSDYLLCNYGDASSFLKCAKTLCEKILCSQSQSNIL